MRLPPAPPRDTRWPTDPEVLRRAGQACSALLAARSNPRIRALPDAEFWPRFARVMEAARRRTTGREWAERQDAAFLEASRNRHMIEWCDPTGDEAARRADNP